MTVSTLHAFDNIR